MSFEFKYPCVANGHCVGPYKFRGYELTVVAYGFRGPTRAHKWNYKSELAPFVLERGHSSHQVLIQEKVKNYGLSTRKLKPSISYTECRKTQIVQPLEARGVVGVHLWACPRVHSKTLPAPGALNSNDGWGGVWLLKEIVGLTDDSELTKLPRGWKWNSVGERILSSARPWVWFPAPKKKFQAK